MGNELPILRLHQYIETGLFTMVVAGHASSLANNKAMKK